MAYEIEADVPIPALGKGSGVKKYPFEDMEVGDSFFVPGQSARGGARISAASYGKRHGKKFAGQARDGGVRIWRTA